ncbi:MAG TPA: S9 family peptidase [Candidatus Baltobacteraceae bacterium]|nr:S9 family peptidase [Candidatus Baltobacteraceae bacterium]
MKIPSIAVSLTLAAACALSASAQTAPSMEKVLQASFSMTGYGGVAISPRGDAVAYAVTTRPGGLKNPMPQTALYVQRNGAAPVRLTAGDGTKFFDESDAQFSPDGSQIAFVSNAGDKDQEQVYIANGNAAQVRQLTHLTGSIAALRWSPDGKHLAILSIPHPHRRAGALAAGARQVGVIGSVIDEQQLAVIDASTGAVRELTPSNAYVYEYGWAPDSKRLTYTYAYGSGDNNWWVARLATIDTSGHAHDLLKPKFQINNPVWSPDGRNIAVIGGLMSDFGSVGGDVYVVNAQNGSVRDVTPGMPLSAAKLQWIGLSQLIMGAHDLGSLMLFRLNANTGARQAIGYPDETIFNWDAAPDGSRIAMVRTSFTRAPEVWVGPPGAAKQITSGNANAPRFWSKAVSLRWQDGAYRPQGWLIYPLDFQAGKRYPMITIVHGGPSAESLPSYTNTTIAALTSHGYFVFEPNPRGSYGQGEAYTRANVKDFGYGDWHDDLSGVDAATAHAPIDPRRLGMWGWSYGGYMGMWAETQTRRFKAIVAGAGVADWLSYYGQNDIDQWMIPFFGASVYDDPQVYARSSPITFIKNSHTPILMLQGERDEEVPAPQSFEFYHAMQTLGVPSRLVVYADEGHGPRKPANQIDVLERTVSWFDHFLS